MTDFEKENITYCNCTVSDYTCSFCYDYDPVNKSCSLSDTCTIYQAHPPPQDCTNIYTSNPAYRRVAGTLCVNDLPYILVGITLPCPTITDTATSTSSASSGQTQSQSQTADTTNGNSTNDDLGTNDFISDPGVVITLIIFVILLGILFIALFVVYFKRAKDSL